MMQKRQSDYVVIQLDAAIDAAVQKEVPRAYRGAKRASVRLDFVLRDWLNRTGSQKVEKYPPTP